VNGANALPEKLDKARQAGKDIDMKATPKELSLPGRGAYPAPTLLAEPGPRIRGCQGADRRFGGSPET